MERNVDILLEEFKNELLNEEKSQHTIRAYIRDVAEFIDWFTETVGEFSPEQITVVDIEEYKSYLHNVKKK